MARGSAANSLVAYVLDITQVDPLANDLLFERFLSPSRAEFELPDIDLDLCWRRRDEVLHYVYRKYGADHVAIVGTHITFRLRSAWREMAKALQIPLHRINRIAAHLPHLPAEDLDGLLDEDEGRRTKDEGWTSEDGDSIRNPQSAIRNSNEREALEMARAIEGLPRHAGMHCAGVVISPQSTPLADLVPLQRAARDPSLSITQYDKDAIEAMGLVKMDLLGSRALTTLVDALHSSGLAGSAAGARSGGDLQKTFALIPFDDERTYNMMAQGETLGCFQLESPGMRGLLKWLRPHNLNDVASAVSLFRPGPLEGGFLELFMRRHLRQEALSYVHPAMEPILRDTYGVILYQEQFLKLAHSLAGLSLGEAEKLRKELGKTHTPDERARLGTQFVAGAIERGIDQLQAEQVWEIIAGYSGFGFCKAHACSYALTAYRSAYMKAHYPAYFLAAQINNGGGYYGSSVYVEEARRLGITLLVPHVNESNAMCEAIANGRAIRFGLQFVKGLSVNTISLILAERRAAGPFYSLQDLLMLVEMTPSEAASLVKVGACDQMEGGENRKQMMHILPSLITARRPRASRYGIAAQTQPRPEAGSTGPLQMVLGDFLPGLMVSPNPRILGDLRFQPEPPFMEEYSPQEKVALEREALGFTLTCNPMELHPQFIKEHDVVLCRDLPSQANKRVTVAGVVVAGRTHRTKAGEQMLFMSVQDTTGLIELVFFPEVYKQHAATIANNGVGPYLVTGQVQVAGRGRGIGVQPPADFTPADIATIKMHPVVIAESLCPVESPEAALLSSA
jgi:DNA polymerase-3 subunit alpha